MYLGSGSEPMKKALSVKPLGCRIPVACDGHETRPDLLDEATRGDARCR
jgi:hypothetical protein